MEFSAMERIYLEQCKYLQQKLKSKNITPNERADIYRQLMEQSRFAAAEKFVDLNDVDSHTRQLFLSYISIIDNTTDSKGANNYAEGSLTLHGNRKNESKSWTSSLTGNRIFGLKCVQKYIQASKVARESLIPDGKEDVVLFKKETTNPKKKGQLSINLIEPQSSDSKPQQKILTESMEYELQPGVNAASFGITPFNGITENRKELQVDKIQTTHTHSISSTGVTSSLVGRNKLFSTNNLSSNKRTDEPPRQPPVPVYRKVEPQKRPFSEVDSVDDTNKEEIHTYSSFKTAREQLVIDRQQKGNSRGQGQLSTLSYGNTKKSLGTRRGLNNKFVPPIPNKEDGYCDGNSLVRKVGSKNSCETGQEDPVDERLKNIEPKMVELITNEIMDVDLQVGWDDIAGLTFAKKTIKEIVVWPILRPDIFTGLRGPPKGLLLFGPPGTGKTMIGKCIASQSKSTFFSISASSLTSKWVGEGEKMVRALFAVARIHQPAVVFIDEIDSLLSQRSDGEHDSSRRIKTEFLVQLDGATTTLEERILVVGATNRPQEIDEAARRRFVKRLYIPLPEVEARVQIMTNLLTKQNHQLTEQQLVKVSTVTEGYSGADMSNLCREAAMGPVRSLTGEDIQSISVQDVRPIIYEDFEMALKQVKSSVSSKDLGQYVEWNRQFGSWNI